MKPVEANGRLREEGGVMVLRGYVGQRQVTANVAMVGDSLHVFTVVSVCECVWGKGGHV